MCMMIESLISSIDSGKYFFDTYACFESYFRLGINVWLARQGHILWRNKDGVV